MNEYILKWLGITGFYFIIMACNVNSGKSGIQNTPVIDTVKVEGCKDSVNMKLGSIIELKLNAVPGSGYQWLLKDSLQLLQLLDADSLKFSGPDTVNPAPGRPGYQFLHFKTLKKGTETLNLEYKRTWEKEIEDRCNIRIVII